MRDKDKTKSQLVNEMVEMRSRIRGLRATGKRLRQAEKELKHSKELCETILNSMNVAITTIDVHDFRIVSVNRVFLNELDLKEEDVIGKTCYEVTHRRNSPCLPPDNVCPLLETVRTGQYSVVEHVHYDSHNRKIYVEISTSPVKDEKGEVCRVVHVARDVTYRKHAEEALRGSEEKLRVIFSSSPDAITFTDLNGTILDCNQATVNLHGFSSRDELVGKNAFELVAERDHERARKGMRKTVKYGSVRNLRYTCIRKDGGEFPAELSASVVRDSSGKSIGFVGLTRDITERRQAEEQLKESEGRFRAIFESAMDGIVLADVESKRLLLVNTIFCEMLGYRQEEVKSLSVKDIHPRDDLPYVLEQFEKQVKKEITVARDIPVKRKDDSVFYADICSSPLTYRGKVILVGIFRDITERRRMEEQLRALSLIDELTGLYNRRGFMTLGQQQLRVADRMGRRLLVFFVDLDALKEINDSLGHREGDKALIDVSNILRDTFRGSDIIARFGGDEFAVMVAETPLCKADVMAKRLQNRVRTYNAKKKRPYRLSISMGTACYDPKKPFSFDELMAQADVLMYKRKREK